MLDAKLSKVEERCNQLERRADKAKKDYAWAHGKLKHLA